MEVSAELKEKLVDEAITICDAIGETFGVELSTPAMYAAMTTRLVAVAEMVLKEHEESLK
jgi:hypothetical protein